MSVKQISVFVQSQPGHLKSILDTFRKNDVNVRGYSCSDTGDYGISRFVVDNPDLGLSALKEQGRAVTLSDVVCLELNDNPGELCRVFGVLADANINVLYSYSLISTFIAIKVKELELAEKVITEAGFTLITQDNLQ